MITLTAYGSSQAQRLNLNGSCDLHHSYGNARSFNPLHQAGDRTCTSAVILGTAVGFSTHCSTVGTPDFSFVFEGFFSCQLLDSGWQSFSSFNTLDRCLQTFIVLSKSLLEFLSLLLIFIFPSGFYNFLFFFFWFPTVSSVCPCLSLVL